MVPRLIVRAVLVAVVGAGCAAGFVKATSASTASMQACFGSIKTLHGHVSMTLNEVATGDAPGIAGSATVSLARHAANVAVQLRKAKSRLGPTWTGFIGKSHGGSFVAEDSLTLRDGGGDAETGTLTAKGAPRTATAGLVAASAGGSCGYELSVGFGHASTFSGSLSVSHTNSISIGFVTPSRHVPPSLKLSGGAVVSAEPTGCELIVRPGGCATFSDGWANDYETLKECHSVVAANCSKPGDTDFGDAKISWSLSPG